MPSSEINALHKKGVAVHDVLLTPEVAYTGEWAGPVRVVLHTCAMHAQKGPFNFKCYVKHFSGNLIVTSITL